jgi:hypothetical protein
VLVIVLGIHFAMRSLAAKSLGHAVKIAAEIYGSRLDLAAAFRKSTGFLHSIFSRRPAGWSSLTRKRLHRVRQKSDTFVQKLNDSFANPSGTNPGEPRQEPLPAHANAPELPEQAGSPKTD